MYHLQAKEQRTKEPEELKLEIIIKAEQAACPTLRTIRTLPAPPSAPSAYSAYSAPFAPSAQSVS